MITLRYAVFILLLVTIVAAISAQTYSAPDGKKKRRAQRAEVGPSIREVKPLAARVGQRVKIEGSGFLVGDLRVTFNGVVASVIDVEPDEVKVIVPDGASSGPLVVTSEARESNSIRFIVLVAEKGTPVLSQRSDSSRVDSTTATSKPSSPVSFSRDVQTIFEDKCTSCHGGSAGLALDDGASFANLVNVPAQKSCVGEKRVVPGNSAMSVLFKKISGTTCGTQMPKKAPPLSAEEIRVIKDWIDAGAVNN
jgi:hypothetical protein